VIEWISIKRIEDYPLITEGSWKGWEVEADWLLGHIFHPKLLVTLFEFGHWSLM